jgi:hypothetical protein
MFVLCRRAQLQMVARLFAVSAAGLKSNPHLVTLVLGVKTLLLVATVPLFAGMASAYQNGQVVQYGVQKGDACFADDNVTQVPCCAWQPDGCAARINELWFILKETPNPNSLISWLGLFFLRSDV